MKKCLIYALLVMFAVSIVGCEEKKASVSDYVNANVKPEMEISDEKIDIDFIEMHNTVLEEMMQEYTPFFYVKENCFDISGDNNPKKITITIECIEGTKKKDVDLFLSYVLSKIGENASEQNFKYSAPSVDSEGTYIDFGTVFDDYALELKATTEDNEIIYNTTIESGKNIPIDPRYWSE